MLNYISDHNETIPQASRQQLARILKVLAEPKRLAIVDLLMQGVQCNCELGDALGMPANLISHHLGVLRKADLVQVERDVSDARWVYYSINRDVIAQLNRQFGAFFDLARIQERLPSCGPRANLIKLEETAQPTQSGSGAN